MQCSLEVQMETLLKDNNIKFTRPDKNSNDPTNLDFYLYTLDIYIKIKRYHSDRIAYQLAKVPEGATAIVLQGPHAVEDFKQLCTAFYTSFHDKQLKECDD